MKILVISNYYPPYYEGGYEISVKETADYLHSKGYQVFILTSTRMVDAPITSLPRKLKENEPYRILKLIDYFHSSIIQKHRVEKFNYSVVRQAIRKIEPDLIYFGNQKAISIAPILAAQKARQKVLFDIGDFWFGLYLAKSFKARAYRWLKELMPFTIGGKIVFQPAIVPSAWMKTELFDRYGLKNVFIIPRGIEIPSDELSKKDLDLSQRPIRFVFAGRIEPKKGLDLCIKALSAIGESNRDFSLDIFGSGEPAYLNDLKTMITQNKLEHHVIFHKPVSNLIGELSNYDVFLMPTMAQEAFGRVLIEAMAAGTIVIASNRFGPAEIITDGQDGFLFEMGSYQALQTCIQNVISMPDKELNRIRSNAFRTVQTKFEISLVKKSIEDIIVKIIKTDSNKEIEV